MQNGILLQAFYWDYPADGRLYRRLKEEATSLAEIGISAVWMPPAGKGTSPEDVGYGNYDYWDLGEFDAKGSVRTKYGTRAELEEAITALHEAGISVYADMIFNHKVGADESEVFQAVMVDQNDRNKDISAPHEIEGWTKFTFPERAGKYSDFVWRYYHFSGVDYDKLTGTNAIYRIVGDGKYWAEDTDKEKGNYDYLLGADIDHNHPEVIEELKRVSQFMIEEMKYDGFRFDALKHISQSFIDELTDFIIEKRPDFYFVGEYWHDSKPLMEHYLDKTSYTVDLFDVPLHFSLYEASKREDFDLRNIFQDTLVQAHPMKAVTFVDNHDSQPGQSLCSWVDPWFREIAHAIILFRKDGYPCLFLGDLLGIPEAEYDGMADTLINMCKIRGQNAYGEQENYFVAPTKIGWVRRGDDEHTPLVVLISSADDDEERMFVGEAEAGQTYVDRSGKNEPITIDETGYGIFTVAPRSVTYWTREKAGS